MPSKKSSKKSSRKSSRKSSKKSTKKSIKITTKTRCYIVYGTGFNPVLIKGIDARNKLMARIKNRGFTPRYGATSRSCTRKATLYGKISGAITIR